MPLDAYYKGEGAQVMAEMVRRYGAKKGREVFYATAQARGLAPKTVKRKKRRRIKRP